MIEIGTNLAMVLKTAMGCVTFIYAINVIVDLIKTVPILLPKTLNKTLTPTKTKETI